MALFYDRDLLESQVFEEEMTEPETDLDETLRQTPGEDVILNLTLENGETASCRAVLVFMMGEKECIALDSGKGEIHILELLRGEDDAILLKPLESREEEETAFEMFSEIVEIERGEEHDRNQDGKEN